MISKFEFEFRLFVEKMSISIPIIWKCLFEFEFEFKLFIYSRINRIRIRIRIPIPNSDSHPCFVGSKAQVQVQMHQLRRHINIETDEIQYGETWYSVYFNLVKRSKKKFIFMFYVYGDILCI
jgi:hypothetical protein